MKKRLLLVDGHNLLFQMFYGMPRKIPGKNGSPIHGVIGFIGALNKLINMLKPTHGVVLFDSETYNPRLELSNEYKATRPDYSSVPFDENPFSQLEGIYHALDFMHIHHAEVQNAECDDVIASYALLSDEDTEVFISSFDSDYFQLITDRVRVIRYRGEASVICDRAYIKSKLGIEPKLYADYKALVGDKTDNISGIRGIGPKTAAKIINTYGMVNEICDRAEEIDPSGTRLAIAENKKLILRNYELIRLDAHAALPFPICELSLPSESFKTMQVIEGIGI